MASGPASRLATLEAEAEVAAVDAAVVATLIRLHVELREATGYRDPALHLVDVVRRVRMRRCARRTAMRRISWIDQRIRS